MITYLIFKYWVTYPIHFTLYINIYDNVKYIELQYLYYMLTNLYTILKNDLF